MTSCPIMETVSDFIFLGSKINVDGDWTHMQGLDEKEEMKKLA